MPDLFSVSNKTFLVTGGSGFICSPLVQTLLELGAQVASFDRIGASQVRDPGQFRQFTGDATSAEQVRVAVKETEKHFGQVDCLVNGVGINIRGSLDSLNVDDLRKVIDVNLVSTVHFTKEFALLPSRGGRSIVNFGSIAGLHGIAGDAAYCISKAAVHSFTKVSALELASKDIRVNAVAPSALRSPMMAALIDDPVKGPKLLEKFPLGRFGEPNDVVGVVIFLCSSAASWITGQTILIDGGRTATV